MNLIKCRDKIDLEAIEQFPQEYGEGFKKGSEIYLEGKSNVVLFCGGQPKTLKEVAKSCGLYEGYMEEQESDIRINLSWR